MLPKFNTILELIQRFPDEKSCHQYLASRRWNGYMECPYEDCTNDKSYVFKDGIRYKCTCCKRVYTAKTKTIFDSSKLPTIKWFLAIYLVMHKKGISSIQLYKDIGVTQKTAWFLLHRIRVTLGNEPEQQLEGNVQLDETFVGGKNKNRHHDKKVEKSQGRSFKDKTPVMGMLQEEEYTYVTRPHKVIKGKMVTEKVITKPSIVKCVVIADTSPGTLQPLVIKHVKEGSVLISDEWQGYRGLSTIYQHEVVDHAGKQYVNEAGYTSNALESFWSQGKRSIIGIYHKTSRKHLSKYFNEFVFRYNYRNLGAQDQLNIVFKNMDCRLKYKDLIS